MANFNPILCQSNSNQCVYAGGETVVQELNAKHQSIDFEALLKNTNYKITTAKIYTSSLYFEFQLDDKTYSGTAFNRNYQEGKEVNSSDFHTITIADLSSITTSRSYELNSNKQPEIYQLFYQAFKKAENDGDISSAFRRDYPKNPPRGGITLSLHMTV